MPRLKLPPITRACGKTAASAPVKPSPCPTRPSFHSRPTTPPGSLTSNAAVAASVCDSPQMTSTAIATGTTTSRDGYASTARNCSPPSPRWFTSGSDKEARLTPPHLRRFPNGVAWSVASFNVPGCPTRANHTRKTNRPATNRPATNRPQPCVHVQPGHFENRSGELGGKAVEGRAELTEILGARPILFTDLEKFGHL